MSVNPRQGHQKKQSWWKKTNRRTNPKRTRTFNNNTNTPQDNTSTTTEPLRIPADTYNNPNQNFQSMNNMNENNTDILTCDPEIITPRQIRTLQTELSRVIRLNQQLEMELNLRASQVEQMEDNLRLVADQSKMIGVRAMEQEQQLLEIKKALELKTKQLALFRGSKADQIPLNEITVLPMHLRGKFSEFLRGILLSQKKFFGSALKDFVANQITDKELNISLTDKPLTRDNLLLEIAKIGNSLAYDYMSELELRLNGTFAPKDTKYTLHTTTESLSANSRGQQVSYTPQRTPNPPPSHMVQRPVSPMYGHGANNTLSSQGVPMINMNAPTHTPMGSVGSAGAMTPQTSISTNNPSDVMDQNGKRKKVKTGGAFDKAKRLLSSKKNKKKVQQQQQQQQQQMQMQQQQMMQQQQQMQMQQQMQYPPPYGQQQPQYHQYPQMTNGHGQFPPQPSMRSIPSTDQKPVSGDREKATNAYNFHKSATSTQNSAGNVAMEALMKEIADAEERSLSGSNSVVIRDGDDDINTDDDYSSDRDDKKENKKPAGVLGVPRIMSNNSDDFHSDSEEDEDDDHFDGNADAQAMQQQLLSMTKQHTQAILTKHGADGSNELNKMWSQFVQFKKGMARPSDAPLAFTVPDKTSSFVELRDMLEALPFDLSCAILREQQMNPYDRIKDVTIQRGCWPMVRYVGNNRVQTINKVFLRFDDVLNRLEMYLQNEKDKSNGPQLLLSKEHLEMMKDSTNSSNKKKVPPGNQLLGALDPQKTTGFRLHQITSIIRSRNEARDTITALNLRVGRLWNMDLSMEQSCGNLITDSIDFFQSLDNPSTMLLLGPNTAEKCALCREICKQLSSSPINLRTALVDTRSTVGGFTKSPIETGQTIRFYVNSVTNQSNQINATRSIYPQVVVVDECLTLSDIESISKLQSEGISVIVGTNMHSLEALLGHPLYSQLLPPQDRLLEHGVQLHTMSGAQHRKVPSYTQYSSMSPHLLILEMNIDGTQVKMYKNIPAAVKAIKRFSQPEYTKYKLKWKGYNTNDTQSATKYINHQLHKRTTSKMVSKLMKDTLSYKNLPTAL